MAAVRKFPRKVKRYEWWKDKQFVAELDRRCKAMESGEDKGVTLEELKISIEKLRMKKYEVGTLPDHVKEDIEEALQQSERGEGRPHEEVMKKYSKWRTK